MYNGVVKREWVDLGSEAQVTIYASQSIVRHLLPIFGERVTDISSLEGTIS